MIHCRIHTCPTEIVCTLGDAPAVVGIFGLGVADELIADPAAVAADKAAAVDELGVDGGGPKVDDAAAAEWELGVPDIKLEARLGYGL